MWNACVNAYHNWLGPALVGFMVCLVFLWLLISLICGIWVIVLTLKKIKGDARSCSNLYFLRELDKMVDNLLLLTIIILLSLVAALSNWLQFGVCLAAVMVPYLTYIAFISSKKYFLTWWKSRRD